LNLLHETIITNFAVEFQVKLAVLVAAAVRFAKVAGRGSDSSSDAFSMLADAAASMGGHAEERRRFNLEPPAMSDDAQPLCEAALRWAVGEHILNDWRDLQKEFARFTLGDKGAGDILADLINTCLADAVVRPRIAYALQRRERLARRLPRLLGKENARASVLGVAIGIAAARHPGQRPC
jgi:hypothetical protein